MTVDGKISPFRVEEQAETYIIYINYSHSQRIIKIYYSSYSLRVNVVGARGQPLSGSQVLLLWKDGDIFDVQTTDADGYAHFNKVPSGNFSIKAEYKGFFVLQSISIDKPEEARISFDIVIEILGLTLTTLNTVFIVVLFVMVVTFVSTITLMKRRKQRSSALGR